MTDVRRFRSRFWHYISNLLQDLSESLRAKAVFHRISVMGQILMFHITYFCFPDVVWDSASGGFHIVSDTFDFETE